MNQNAVSARLVSVLLQQNTTGLRYSSLPVEVNDSASRGSRRQS